MFKHLGLAAIIILVSLWHSAFASCAIVYGSNWAFLYETPTGWNSACSDKAMSGTAVTLWPAKDEPSAAEALIYVTVSIKNPIGLKAFAHHDEARFKKKLPDVTISLVKTGRQLSKYKYIMARFHEPSAHQEELVAYVAGPTADYTVVIATGSIAALKKYKSGFLEFLANFVPMTKEQ